MPLHLSHQWTITIKYIKLKVKRSSVAFIQMCTELKQINTYRSSIKYVQFKKDNYKKRNVMRIRDGNRSM